MVKVFGSAPTESQNQKFGSKVSACLGDIHLHVAVVSLLVGGGRGNEARCRWRRLYTSHSHPRVTTSPAQTLQQVPLNIVTIQTTASISPLPYKISIEYNLN